VPVSQLIHRVVIDFPIFYHYVTLWMTTLSLKVMNEVEA